MGKFINRRYKQVYERIISLANDISAKDIRDITIDLLRNPVITFAKVEPKIEFYESPAAPHKHHSYPGGLLDHTLGVALTSLKIAEVEKEVYNIEVDTDIVLAAALLHDIYKYYQYDYDELTNGFRIRSDWFLSHDFAVIAELAKRNASEKLLRVIAEAHGTTPFSTLESIIVHEADSVDASFASTLQSIIWNVCRDVEIAINVPAIKIFNTILSINSLSELAYIYFNRGRNNLREHIISLVKNLQEIDYKS